MVLRLARPADAEAIAVVHVTTWQTAYHGLVPGELLDQLSIERSAARWRNRLEHPAGHTVLVCEHDGAVVGFISLGASRDDDAATARVGEIYALYLAPAMWDQGMGAALMVAALERLHDQGYQEATLWVLENNLRAQRFYAKAGFSRDDGRKVEARGEGVLLAELRYRRRLP